MRETAENDKNMENRVHIAALYAESVEYRAERVEHAARDKQYKAHEPQRAISRHDGKDYAPTHADVAYHRKYTEFSEVYRRQRYRHRRKSPYDTENRPADRLADFCQRADRYRRVGSDYQKVDRAMVNDLKHFFRVAARNAVVDARHGVEHYHRQPVDYRGYDARYVFVYRRDRYAGY